MPAGGCNLTPGGVESNWDRPWLQRWNGCPATCHAAKHSPQSGPSCRSTRSATQTCPRPLGLLGRPPGDSPDWAGDARGRGDAEELEGAAASAASLAGWSAGRPGVARTPGGAGGRPFRSFCPKGLRQSPGSTAADLWVYSRCRKKLMFSDRCRPVVVQDVAISRKTRFFPSLEGKRMVSGHTGNVVLRKELWVRIPCPPL